MSISRLRQIFELKTSFLFSDTTSSQCLNSQCLKQNLFRVLQFLLENELGERDGEGGVFLTGSVVAGRPSLILEKKGIVRKLSTFASDLSPGSKFAIITDRNICPGFI